MLWAHKFKNRKNIPQLPDSSLLETRHAKSWDLKKWYLKCVVVFEKQIQMNASFTTVLKHHNIYTYNPLFKEYVQINCSDICKSKSRFPEKNNLFACLLGTNIFGHLFLNKLDMNILGYISNKPYSPFFLTYPVDFNVRCNNNKTQRFSDSTWKQKFNWKPRENSPLCEGARKVFPYVSVMFL